MVMESAIISLVSDRVLNLTAGAFSERWNLIAESLGKSADRVSVPWGQAIDPDLVQRALERERYDAVTLVHNETSTGVIQPLEEITRVVREHSDALLLVDAVSSLGGARIETDEWEVDLLLTGSQKALALPPGLAFFCLSERAVERTYEIQHRGYYTDLKRYLEKHRAGGTITTPGLPQIFALDRQLDAILQEGVENRWRRHLELQRMTSKWAMGRGFQYASAETSHSPTVSCLRPPPNIEAPGLVKRLALSRFTVGGGYGNWRQDTFRIGHMGEVQVEDLAQLLGAIDEII